jgi:hypothetical protein
MKRSLHNVYPTWREKSRTARPLPSGGRRIRHMMSRLVALSVLAAAPLGVVAGSASASNNHVSGIQSPALTPGPGDPCPSATALASYTMTGSLVGCWYTDSLIVTKDTTRHGIETIDAIGTEHFVGCLDVDGNGQCAGADPQGTLAFTYTFTGQYDATTGHEIRGRCHHPIVSGTRHFAEATGVLKFNDDVANGTSLYEGHIKL